MGDTLRAIASLWRERSCQCKMLAEKGLVFHQAS